jgi:hypothetical protein
MSMLAPLMTLRPGMSMLAPLMTLGPGFTDIVMSILAPLLRGSLLRLRHKNWQKNMCRFHANQKQNVLLSPAQHRQRPPSFPPLL